MWRLVFSVVLWNIIASQPLTDIEDARAPRQLDFGECCPCTDANRDVHGFDRSGPGFSSLEDLDAVAGATNADFVAGALTVDDCPCRFRDADSEGSPSVFFPRAMRPVRPVVMPQDTKEEPKPLLHPEVDLASSVLETLREATDEEYQDALARDAARNAARVSELRDANPETAENVVTIIVNPKEDDAIPEASQTQETRCAHPLGTTGQVRESEPSIFKLGLDMDSGASDVQEQVVGINKGLEGLKLKTSPHLLKLFPTRKPAGARNIQSLLKLRNSKPFKDVQSDPKIRENSLGSKIPSLKLPPLFKKNDKKFPLKSFNLELSKLNIPKLKIPQARKLKVFDSDDLDTNPSPSSIDEQVSSAPLNLINPKIGAPFALKNLLNLKDVELIPSKPLKPLLPGLYIPPLRINKPGTSFSKERKIKSKSKKGGNCNNKRNTNNQSANIQEMPKKKQIKTEILDAIPHASENHPIVLPNDNEIDITSTNSPVSDATVIPRRKKVKTEILDALPSASKNHHIVVGNAIEPTTPVIQEDFGDAADIPRREKVKTEILDALPSASENHHIVIGNAIEPTTPVGDIQEDFGAIQDFDGQSSEDAVTETINKISKDNINHTESDEATEIFIDGNGNNESEELEIIDHSNVPTSEIEISGDSINTDGVEIEIEDGLNSGLELSDVDDFDTVNGDEISKDKDIDFEPDQGSQAVDEDSNSFEFFREDPKERSNQDAVPEANNQNIEVMSFDGMKEKRGDITSTEEISQINIAEPKMSSSTDNALSSIKERITLKLETLKNPDTKIFTISRLSKPEINKNEEMGKSSFDSEEEGAIEPLHEDTEQFPVIEKSANEGSNLDSQDQNTKQEARESENNLSLSNTSSDIESEPKENIDMDSLATSNADTLGFIDNDDHTGFSDSDTNQEFQSDEIGLSENTCPCGIESAESKSTVESTLDLTESKDQSNEMSAEASASTFNTLPLPKLGSPILQQNIVQPTSLFDGLFTPIAPLDIGTLPQLPTLDDIRSGISSLLGGNARASESGELSSTEFDTAEDCSDTNTGASTKSLKSAFLSSRPLEDVNLDIFQINPLTKSSPLLKRIPMLNSNSFKTKLSLPQPLEPMKLQSTLRGKNGGLLGATLTLRPDKFSTSRKAKPVSQLGSILNKQGADILGNPLANMPSLEDLRTTMRANAQSLLNSPLTKQLNEPLKDTLRTTQTLGTTLRSHTENAMRNLQQSLASTLTEATVSKAAGKFAKPQDLLERVAAAHDDMNDKLHGIHVDLKDRLESLQDNIKSQSNLPTLKLPLLDNSPKFDIVPLYPNSKSELRRPSHVFQSPQPKSPLKKTKLSTKNVSKLNKPVSIKGRLPDNRSKVIPFKMSKAASSLTPKAIDVPILTTTSSKPPFFKPLQRDQSVQLKEARPRVQERARSQRPASPSNPRTFSSPVTDSAIHIRYKPQSTRSQPKAKSSLPRSQSGHFSRTRESGFTDLRGFASEQKPVRIPSPARPISRNSESSEGLGISRARSMPSRTKTPPSTSSISSKTHLKLAKMTPLPLRTTAAPKLSLPRPTESPLLTKMRDSLRIRLSRPLETKKSSAKLPRSDDIMSKSASETKNVMIKAETMKENVSYKCKMVCVRE